MELTFRIHLTFKVEKLTGNVTTEKKKIVDQKINRFRSDIHHNLLIAYIIIC